MGIRTIIAIGFSLVVINAQAATNSWIYVGSDFWDTASRWSTVNPPSITDAADMITNTSSKTVTIDDTDTAAFPQTLTISNLTVSAPTVNLTNTLSLFDMNDGGLIPLDVLNGLTIGNRGVLQITNSMLQVGGTFQLIGTMQVLDLAQVQVQSATVSNSAVILFALSPSSSPIVVSNNLTLGGKINVIDGGGFTSTSYTLFTYGGALATTGLTLGTTPTNFTCVIDTNTAGLVKLNVTGTQTVPFQIASIVQSGNNITINWVASVAGSNTVQAENGNCNTNNFADLSSPMAVTAGVTNTYTDVGGATNSPARFYRIHGF